MPERVVEVASAQAGCPVAAYVLDVEGSFAVRLAGDAARFPERIRARLWLIVADATGNGNSAAALSSLAIGALRAARRAGAGLQEAARLVDEAILATPTGSASAAPPTAAGSARLACARSSPSSVPARQRRRCAAYKTQ
ncbi:MAG TPA: SpoIIE family protein phosphatase [Solirubrobacteraceae bacterium]|nr:SpoIIE family protein phosphatase [Solirubrobacteraceae bacterium]